MRSILDTSLFSQHVFMLFEKTWDSSLANPPGIVTCGLSCCGDWAKTGDSRPLLPEVSDLKSLPNITWGFFGPHVIPDPLVVSVSTDHLPPPEISGFHSCASCRILWSLGSFSLATVCCNRWMPPLETQRLTKTERSFEWRLDKGHENINFEITALVGGFLPPVWKICASQTGSFPQVVGMIFLKKMFESTKKRCLWASEKMTGPILKNLHVWKPLVLRINYPWISTLEFSSDFSSQKNGRGSGDSPWPFDVCFILLIEEIPNNHLGCIKSGK